jgi:hypothetical protein
MEEISGKNMAYVVENDFELEDCPYKGCIKVVCPDLLGWSDLPPMDAPFEIVKDLMIESGWVRPHWTHPMDFYVPEIGEGVYIEALAGGDVRNLIWTGFYPGEDFINQWTYDSLEGVNTQVVEYTDRIYGTRNGTYIKIEDVDDGKFIIEVCGKNKSDPSRIGHKFTIDPAVGLEYADKDGASKITFDVDGMSIIDSQGNKVTLDSSGIIIEDLNGNKLTKSASGVILKDANGNEIQMAAAGCTLKTGDASIWMPNILATCLFTGAPHGGTGAGIVKLKGA